MSTLDTYNPLKSCTIPGGETVSPNGVVVIVGPNSSGKTLFLRDIESFLFSGDREFVVLQGLDAELPSDFDAFFDDLIKQNYLRPSPNEKNGFMVYVPFLRHTTEADSTRHISFTRAQLHSEYTSYDQHVQKRGTLQWFRKIGAILAALLSLDKRKELCQKSSSFNYASTAPKSPIQSLYVSHDAQDLLSKETGRVFGNAAWLDISEKDILRLRVSGSGTIPSHGHMSNPLQAVSYSPIDREGDGYLSYVSICLSMLVVRRPVTLIDEPELCLHPPQAYHIGKFIGEYASSSHVTFVATHSSNVLRGILEAGNRVTVIRLTKQNGKFCGRLVADDELVNCIRNPRSRAESVLDGLFAQAVVLVEGEGDREVYQAAAEAMPDYPSREIHFVQTGGYSGLAEPLQFYRKLNIPTAVIVDLESMCDVDKISKLVSILAENEEAKANVIAQITGLSQRIKSAPPSISAQDVRDRLREISEIPMDWQSGADNLVRRALNELSRKISRLRRLKDGGIDAYNDDLEMKQSIVELVKSCNEIGLFFVPVGELENWVADLMKGVSKSSLNKTERAAIAADRIRSAPRKEGDVWHFISEVFNFLKRAG